MFKKDKNKILDPDSEAKWVQKNFGQQTLMVQVKN